MVPPPATLEVAEMCAAVDRVGMVRALHHNSNTLLLQVMLGPLAPPPTRQVVVGQDRAARFKELAAMQIIRAALPLINNIQFKPVEEVLLQVSLPAPLKEDHLTSNLLLHLLPPTLIFDHEINISFNLNT